jgi:uncharacterized membrane protein YqhA
MGTRTVNNPSRRIERTRIPPLIAFLFGTEVLLAVFSFLAGDRQEFPKTLKFLFHAGRESNVTTWFSTVQLALVGFLFFCIFLHERLVRSVGTACVSQHSARVSRLNAD